MGKKTLDFSIAQAILNYNIGYEAGSLGTELGIESPGLKSAMQQMDVTREKPVISKPRKKRKKVDPHYGAGEH